MVVADPRLSSAHNHPLEGPVVIVHSPGPVTHEGITETPMHAFGPFPSEEIARAWADAGPSDDCYKLIIDLLDPWR
jgi:hypothetical protein